MSIVLIRAALETALQQVNADIDIAWENRTYVPQPDVPFLKVWLLPAKPSDITMGKGYRREQGIFQVNVSYPNQEGPRDAAERAELIRSSFPRGATFTSGGVTVAIGGTPEIVTGMPIADHYQVPVRIPYWANIFN